MPQSTEIKGKVLQHAVRRGVTALDKPYAFAWCQLMDGQLREIVEVTKDISDGSPDPFEGLNRGQFVSYPVGNIRMYHGMLTGALVDAEAVEGQEATEDADAEAPF